MRSGKSIIRLGAFALTVLWLLCCLAGCQAAGAADADSQLPRIVVGIDKYPPYSYVDAEGRCTGIDVELATLVFQRLGYAPEFQVIAWQEKNELLENGSIDCIWSCYSMNEREELYQWAGPYLNSAQVIAVRSDSGIEGLDALADKRVGVQATTRAAALFLHETASALPAVYRVHIFATAEDMLAAMRKGYVDAVAGHEAVISSLVTEGAGEYRLLPESPQISRAGVAFPKGTHVELTEQIDQLFAELTADGTIAQIVERYGLDASRAVIGGVGSEG